MSSNRIIFDILPADTDNADKMMDMDDTMTETKNSAKGKGMDVIKESPQNDIGKGDNTANKEDRTTVVKNDVKKDDKNDDNNDEKNDKKENEQSDKKQQNIFQQNQSIDLSSMEIPQMLEQRAKSNPPLQLLSECLDGQIGSQLNGQINGQINNQINGQLEGQINGQINSQLNGQLHGQLNGTMNEEVNQFDQVQDYTQSYSTQQFFGQQYQSENQMMESYEQSQTFCNVYVNDGINIIDPSSYSPMVYVVEGNKMIYSNNYPFVYDSVNRIKKNSSLPYAYISRNSFAKPDFNIVQNKLKLYNYWIETTNPKHIESQIIEMFGSENIYVTKSLFFRKKSSYMGEKVILISKLPQKPFKFINRINRTFTKERRTIKSVLGDYIISPDCLFIILAERSIDYICNNYYRYHKSERLKIETLIKSFKKKFTCINENDIN